ncbi:MAG TPA: lysylphosphatidylglycerol synthase transmembrane domain-containing protein [Chloroflexota bacterium]|nr:lysylphosphatidylglycerol synthase transmembrane domain-containing protein [Chloroflexota bacterium]
MQVHLVRRLSIIGLLMGLAAIALALSGTAAQLVTMLAALGRLRPGTIGAALALSVLSALLSGVVWWRLLLRLGHRMPFRAALAAYLNAGLAGYVVNIAGPAVGCALSLRRHGVSPGRAILLTLIANVLGFFGILVWAPVGLLLLSRGGMDTALPILGRYGPAAADGILAALVVAMLLALHVLAAAAGSGHRMARVLFRGGRTADEGDFPAPRYRQLLALVPYSALSWVVGALALYVVLAAMSHNATVPLVTVVGAAVIAAALGSLAFFAPEGVGVKDGALVALLTHATGLPLTTALAAALAVRALDPVTKLGLLGVLVVTANEAPARLLAGVASRLPHGKAAALPQRMRVATGRRRVALMGAGVLTLVAVLSGYGAFVHADQDLVSAPELRHAAPGHAVSSNHRPARVDAAVVAVLRTNPDRPGRPATTTRPTTAAGQRSQAGHV